MEVEWECILDCETILKEDSMKSDALPHNPDREM